MQKMYSHRGLPNNLPPRKTKAKIFSTSPSPSKRTESMTAGDSIQLQSPLRTPQKRSLSSQSKHKIVLKQKPIHLNPLIKKTQKRNFEQSTNRDLDIQQKSQNQIQKPKFVNTILNMMGGLIKGSKFSTIQKQKNNQHKEYVEEKQNQNKHQIEEKIQKVVFGPQLVQTSNKIKTLGKTIEQYQLQILQNYTRMLDDKSCWLSYNGGVAEGLREGYGILYFKNKDKFMGAFKRDKAHGHGTFYVYSIGKRIMSKWQDNQLKIQQGYIIEQL